MPSAIGVWIGAAVLLVGWLLVWRGERQAKADRNEQYRRFLGFLASIRDARR
jgi:hypothetical protein